LNIDMLGIVTKLFLKLMGGAKYSRIFCPHLPNFKFWSNLYVVICHTLFYNYMLPAGAVYISL
jgi:hypothetical protein